jgi:O-succinylbenzoic acid--CoA ligase
MVTCEREPSGATAGLPMPGIELRVVAGEIELRGPQVMRGYRGHPPVDGWFRTGDLGELDPEGRLVVHARRSDLIVSGGENVYPAEIEAVLAAHPQVSEAAVVAAPDERWGQVGVAFVSAGATEAELRAFLRERLASFKLPARFVFVPARFVFVDALPRLANGKPDRRALQSSLQPDR